MLNIFWFKWMEIFRSVLFLVISIFHSCITFISKASTKLEKIINSNKLLEIVPSSCSNTTITITTDCDELLFYKKCSNPTFVRLHASLFRVQLCNIEMVAFVFPFLHTDSIYRTTFLRIYVLVSYRLSTVKAQIWVVCAVMSGCIWVDKLIPITRHLSDTIVQTIEVNLLKYSKRN